MVRGTSDPTTAPNVNGIYAVGNEVASGQVIVYIGTSTGFTDNGLSQGTQYFYRIYTCDKAFNYSTAATCYGTTTSGGSPTISLVGTLTNFGNQVVGTSSGSQSYQVYGTNLTEGITVTAPANFEVSLDNSNWYSSRTLTLQGDSVPHTTIYVRFSPGSSAYGAQGGNIAHTSSGANQVNQPAAGNGLDTEPATQASGVGFADVTASSMTVSWSRGDGDSVIVLARASADLTADPADGTDYTANAAYGSGTPLGGGYVVYKGTGTSFSLTGLAGSTTYYVRVYEYNSGGVASSTNYLMTPATGSQATQAGSQASDYFRSKQSGNWNATTTWESSSDGVNWIDATLTPNNNANTITIRSGDTVTMTASVTYDQVVVEAGAQVTVAPGVTHSLVNGAGIDLIINGTWLNQGGAWSPISGSWVVNDGGTFIHNTTAGIATPLGLATLSSGSNFIYRGSSSLTPSVSLAGRTYGNLKFESVSGSWTVSTGTSLNPLTVNGTLIIDSGVTADFTDPDFAGFNFNGDVIVNGTFKPRSFAVASGKSVIVNGYLDMVGENAITGSGSFVLSAGATLGIGSQYGLSFSSGNVQVSKTLDPGANYIFTSQPNSSYAMGDEFPITVNDLTLNLANSDDIIFPAAETLRVNGTLNITQGWLDAWYLYLYLSHPIQGLADHLFSSDPPSTYIFITGSGSNIVLPSSLDTLGALTVDNPNGLALAANLGIVDSLKLTNGILNTGSDTLTLGENATITENDTAYVIGNVQTTRNLTQNTNETFGGLGLELNAAGDEPGATTVTRTTGTAIVQGSVQSIKRYFHIEPTNNAGLNAQLVFHYLNSELNGLNEEDLALFRSPDLIHWGIFDTLMLTLDTVNNTATATGIDSFSYWTLGDKKNPLAVSLASFSALGTDGAVTLSWRTESENGSYQWLVERSESESGPFEELVRLPAAGTSQVPKDYSWSDVTARAGVTYYYRIGELSQDGRLTYFGPVSCSLGRSMPPVDLALGCAPNPFAGSTYIKFQIPKAGNISLKVYNVAGQCVRSLVSDLRVAGSHLVRWDGRDDEGGMLSAGVYMLKLDSPDGSLKQRLVLIR